MRKRSCWLCWTVDELRKWNRRRANRTRGCANFSDDNRIKTDNIWCAIAGFGLKPLPRTEGGNNVRYSIEHLDGSFLGPDGFPGRFEEQRYISDGHEYMIRILSDFSFLNSLISSKCTGAYYKFTVNQADGGMASSRTWKHEQAYWLAK